MHFRYILLSLCLLIGLSAQGAVHSTDSLLQVVQALSNQRATPPSLDQLLELGEQLRHQLPDSARAVAKRVLVRSEAIGYGKGILEAHNQLGIYARDQGNYDAALNHYAQSQEQARILKDSLGIAQALQNQGIVYRKTGELQQALEATLEAVGIFQRLDDAKATGHALNSMANIYAAQGNLDKALEYFEQARIYQERAGNQKGISRSMLNMGIIYYQQSKLEAALEQFKACLEIEEALGNTRVIADLYNNIGGIYQELTDYEAAALCFTKSQTMLEALGDTEGVIYALHNLGNLYLTQGQYGLAIRKLEQSLVLSKRQKLPSSILYSYEYLAETYKHMDSFQQAFAYQEQYLALKDSLFTETQSEQLISMQEKYESEKKEQENQLLEKDNELKTQKLETQQADLRLGNAMLAGACMLLVIAVLSVLFYRQKATSNRLMAAQLETESKQKIIDLVKEQEVEKMNALVEGQSTERKRIAHDLHNSISNQLVTTKLLFDNLADATQPWSTKQTEKFSTGVQLLHDACKDVRAIAHDLADDELSRFGLVNALQKTLDAVGQSGALKTHLNTFKVGTKLPSAVEVQVFRMIQELLNNTLKHAAAKQIWVNLTLHENFLNIMYEDNGIGFDPNARTHRGMGLAQLIEKTTELNGTIDIDAAKGRGTTVTIDLPFS